MQCIDSCCIYTMLSPALNRSSEIQHFEHSDAYAISTCTQDYHMCQITQGADLSVLFLSVLMFLRLLCCEISHAFKDAFHCRVALLCGHYPRGLNHGDRSKLLQLLCYSRAMLLTAVTTAHSCRARIYFRVSTCKTFLV